jgi:hypothetical protein
MTVTSQQLFDSLVKNAIDFLNQSILDLKANPKYSVINFCASIELFLKARLMAEHWALIYDDPKEANKTKFIEGDFKSVSIEESIRRLKKISHVQVSEKAEKSFNQLREHRNKLIHFFHPDYSNPPNEQVLETIVAEQCKGWLHLHRLLTNDWKIEFTDYLGDLDKLNHLMLKQRSFLKAKYDTVFPDIKKGLERGAEFLYCQSCGFQSSRVIDDDSPLAITVCMVCENQEKFLIAPCPNCEEKIYVYDLGEGYCEECHTKIEMDYLLDTFGDTDLSEENRAYCSDCEYPVQPSVVQLDEYRWLCLNCLSFHDEVGHCEWCSELVTGDTTSTVLSGCAMCEGRDGWVKD